MRSISRFGNETLRGVCPEARRTQGDREVKTFAHVYWPLATAWPLRSEDLNGMAHLPRITIVTPSLNQGRFIRQCIESVLSQDYENLEYFIIDGQSTDNTLDVVKEYENSLAFWISEPDAGQSDAINKGFKRASGDLVAWLNADDFYLPDALRTVAQTYSQCPEAPFYFGDGLRVDEAGNFKENFFPEGRVLFDREALLFGLNYILQPSTFINRLSLEHAGYLDPELHYGMDSELWMRLSARGEPCPIPIALAASREYASTKTASGMFERIEELRKISRRHSGAEMTPGVLCYFFEALHRYSCAREDVFDRSYRQTVIEPLWVDTADLLAKYAAGRNGYPYPPGYKQPSRLMTSLCFHLRKAMQKAHFFLFEELTRFFRRIEKLP
jgi:GT2 family glycosyltransferase